MIKNYLKHSIHINDELESYPMCLVHGDAYIGEPFSNEVLLIYEFSKTVYRINCKAKHMKDKEGSHYSNGSDLWLSDHTVIRCTMFYTIHILGYLLDIYITYNANRHLSIDMHCL